MRTGKKNCSDVTMPVMKRTASVALGIFRAMAWDARTKNPFHDRGRLAAGIIREAILRQHNDSRVFRALIPQKPVMFSKSKHIVNVFNIDTNIGAFYFLPAWRQATRVDSRSGASGHAR